MSARATRRGPLLGHLLLAAPRLCFLGCLAAAALLCGRLALDAQASGPSGAQAAAAASWVFWLCVAGAAVLLLGSFALRPRRDSLGLGEVPALLRVSMSSQAAMLFLASAAAGLAAVVWIDGRQATALAPAAASMLAGSGALVCLLGLLFALVSGILAGRSLRAEARELAARLDGLTLGGPEIGRLPVYSSHETGRIAAAFNRLAGRVEGELQRLESYAAQVERAERMRALFLRNVSHELRTPLNSILGYSDLLLRSAIQAPRARESLTVIRDEGERLLLLINDILWTAQLEASRVMLYPGPFLLAELVPAVQALGPGFRRMQLSLALPAGLTEIVADAPRLVRSVAAMLEFAGGGQRTIVVEAWPGDRVSLRVRTGGPLPTAEAQASLFRGFGRPADAAPGLHLGLALARRVAQLHGGELTLRERDGEGEIVLSLPARGSGQEAQT